MKTLHELHNEIEKQREKDRKYLKPHQWTEEEIKKLSDKCQSAGAVRIIAKHILE